MAKDRFRTRYSSTLHSIQKTHQESCYTKAPSQPIRKYDERFAFGKYKGKHVMEAPTSYLKWVLNNWQGLTEDQARIIKRYI